MNDSFAPSNEDRGLKSLREGLVPLDFFVKHWIDSSDILHSECFLSALSENLFTLDDFSKFVDIVSSPVVVFRVFGDNGLKALREGLFNLKEIAQEIKSNSDNHINCDEKVLDMIFSDEGRQALHDRVFKLTFALKLQRYEDGEMFTKEGLGVLRTFQEVSDKDINTVFENDDNTKQLFVALLDYVKGMSNEKSVEHKGGGDHRFFEPKMGNVLDPRREAVLDLCKRIYFTKPWLREELIKNASLSDELGPDVKDILKTSLGMHDIKHDR